MTEGRLFSAWCLRPTDFSSICRYMPKPRSKRLGRVRVGVDTGGTFTDFVFEANGQIEIFKFASTPADPFLAIDRGLQQIARKTGVSLDRIEVVPATNVGANA